MSPCLTLALIPARGGSKGSPRKNIRPLCGRPLIAWSIRDALQTPGIDRVVVSTDDAEIAAVAREHGADVVMRPPELATDTSSSEAALAHALDQLEAQGETIGRVVFLQATSPVRGAKHLAAALARFDDSGADSLLSVTASHVFLWEETPDGAARPLNYDPQSRPMRQAMRQFRENGSIYIFRTDMFRRSGCRLGGRIVLYPMPPECEVDIDTLADWDRAEPLLKDALRHDR
jgi:N-acylneuraminate cytidylyltransferase